MTSDIHARGRVTMERFESDVLRGNAAGDPHVRTVPVYLPPSYDSSDYRYPVVFMLSGFLGRGRMMLNDDPWKPPLDERMDRLVASGACDEVILVMVDCFTRFGGSQYVNSSATGRYEDHVIDEIVPWAEATFRTLAGREHRGLCGKSSGGYGALTLGMKHADVFGGIACHSGDMYFDYCYRGDVPIFLRNVQQAGGLQAWLEDFEARKQRKHDDFITLNVLGMAASYSPNPDTPPFGIDPPCDLDTGEFRQDVWDRWLRFDPLNMLEMRAEALRSMKLLFIDCGTRDEFHLQHGARMFRRRLAEMEIEHEYEEFDDGHMGITYRYDTSLPKLVAALGH